MKDVHNRNHVCHLTQSWISLLPERYALPEQQPLTATHTTLHGRAAYLLNTIRKLVEKMFQA